MNSLVDIQLKCIAPDKGVVAIPNRTESNQPILARSDDPLTQQMVGVDSAATIQKLLDEAIARARRAVPSSSRPPALTMERLVWRYSGLYHLTHATPQLMYEASQGFTLLGSDYRILAEWATKKACEEKGHDRLALSDIRSLGYQAEDVVETLVPPAALALIDYFIRSVQAPDSLGCVGYCYALERLALIVGEKFIQTVEALLPPGTKATNCVRIHSSLGSDLEHVKETIEMVTELDSEKRRRVVETCYETALLCFTPPKEGYISDEELQNKLEPLRIHDDLR